MNLLRPADVSRCIAIMFFLPAAGYAQTCTSLGGDPDVTYCYGFRFSEHGLSGVLAGEAPLQYSVQYFTSAGPRNKGPIALYVHGGAWGYTAAPGGSAASYTSASTGPLASTTSGIGGNGFARKLLTAGAGAVYDLTYTLTARMELAEPVDRGARTLKVRNDGTGPWYWPLSADPNYYVTIDADSSSAETVLVTGQSGTYPNFTLTVADPGVVNAHNKIYVEVLDSGGRSLPGPGIPGQGYAMNFSSAGGCATPPSGTYSVNPDGLIDEVGYTIASNGDCSTPPDCVAVNCFPAHGWTWDDQPTAMVGFGQVLPSTATGVLLTQFPTGLNNILSMSGFLKQCAAGGLTPGAGPCLPYADQPAPGDPNDLRCFGDSAGAHLCAMLAMTGAKFLDNTAGSPGESEWKQPSTVTAAAVWSFPANLNSIYDDTLAGGAAYWAVSALLGCGGAGCRIPFEAASPQSYIGSGNPRMMVVNGTKDTITPDAQVQPFCDATPNNFTCIFVQGYGHELDTWTFPGVTLGNILKFLFPD